MRVSWWVRLCFVPLMLLALVGIRDYGMAFWQERKLGDAAFAGTRWARAYGYDESMIAAAARSATDLAEITVNPLRLCGCRGAKGVTQTDCSASCSGGDWPQPYIIVRASTCFKTLLHWPRLFYCSNLNTECSAAACGAGDALLSSQDVALQ